MTVVKCPIAGTFLVRDERQPIPLGKTPTDVSTVVQLYSFGWICVECGPSLDTAKETCWHVRAAQAAE